MRPYIVLSPVGDHRTKYVEDWLAAVENFVPPPEKIVVCLDKDSDYLNAEWTLRTTKLVNDVIYEPKSYLSRICASRELLRKYFLDTKLPEALWIDTDIICPPELPSTLEKVMLERNVVCVVNRYKGRTAPDSMWQGSGVMLTSRNACMASRFWVAEIEKPDGTVSHLSEDYVFFSIMDQGESWLKEWAGVGGRVSNEYVKVDHRIEPRKEYVMK